MLKGEREREIINLLKSRDSFISVKELCDKLYASESSIRRDLTSLEKKGIISRTYGGAELIKNFSSVKSFNKRFNHNRKAKQIIADKAKKLIKDGSIIFLDQSSSAFYLANEIIDNSTLTVVTNNIEIISLLSNSGIRVISSGGILSNENRTCLIGADAHNVFESIYADTVFFSAKSLSADGVISDCTREEILIRNIMLKNADTKVFLCDSEKLNTHSFYKQCSLKEVDYLISENEKALEFKKHFPTLKLI